MLYSGKNPSQFGVVAFVGGTGEQSVKVFPANIPPNFTKKSFTNRHKAKFVKVFSLESLPLHSRWKMKT